MKNVLKNKNYKIVVHFIIIDKKKNYKTIFTQVFL